MIPVDTGAIVEAIEHRPLFSCPCDPDNGRYHLLARHRLGAAGGRSVLFNGHIDVVPTGPETSWTRPPFEPWVDDGWLQGRGAGPMKGGLVCVLTALLALRGLGWQPAGLVGFNAVPASMRRVAATTARFIVDGRGVEPLESPGS